MMGRTRAIEDIRAEAGDDTPLRLDIAAKIAFPDGSIGASSLRREARRGTLQIWRVAGKDMTTVAAIQEMIKLCLAKSCQPASGSPRQEPTAPPSGSSSTEASRSALGAARMRVKQLKNASANISPESTTPKPEAGRVVPLRSL